MQDHTENDFTGCYIKPDGWKIGEKLIPSDWDQADYYLPTGYDFGITKLAVNIAITGRTHRFDSPISGPAMRCSVVFVGDGDPDVKCGAWIKWPV